MTPDYNPHLGYLSDVVNDNLGLVHHIAKKFRGRINASSGYDDLVSEGSIGLIKAFEYFDPTKVEGDIKFSTYAARMIQGYIQTFLSTKGATVRTPRSVITVARKISELDLWDAPESEIVEKTGYSLKRVKQAQIYKDNQQVSSLDFVTSDQSESNTLLGLIPTEDDATYLFVEEFINTLKPREQKLIRMILTGTTQYSIAEVLGVTQSYVSRMTMKIGRNYKQYLGIPESEEKSMTSNVTTRKVSQEEAKQHGIKTLMDGIEWYTAVSAAEASVGVNATGIHLNVSASKMISVVKGDRLKVGFNPEKFCLIIFKSEEGQKLSQAYGSRGNVCLNNKRLGRWLESKEVARKRYLLQFDETHGIYFIKLEKAGA
ncbi:sigma-70 family RNA polymerase sigma factor [Paenibacillus sp. UMB7766-LJ446]|uniref:sigma-70 family RNA polymerase sigma factor n=1 Tax=Paenibacillus sp. UMB7766-LJ446 TaxID=3046313 RepID=UPI002550FD22|nr:sigma-70 family RNA polymerase sigma factor [Paenibacillus sp. UMB7766-LJ446]MDK8188992.1 sigma-70 family RNA polymerase sigma factor [Paenibacillus sp. UMB7766-LJ446]